MVHGAAHALKTGIEPESFLEGASVAIRLYRNLQAAVERELDEELVTRMRERQVENLSKAFKHLMHKDEEERNEAQCSKDGEVLEQTGSARTRNKTRRRTRKPKNKKQESASRE